LNNTLTMISIWEQETFYRDTDVLIAGGGLMGLWTAWELTKQQPGIKVTICEALPVPALASTRNAGFACFGSPSELWADREIMGEDEMWAVAELRFKGIGKIRKIFGDEVIGYDPSGGYEVYKQDAEWNGDVLEEKLALLNRGFKHITGLKKTYSVRTADLHTFGFSGFADMAGNDIEGGVHSGRLVNALVNAAGNGSVNLLMGHKVAAVVGQEGNFKVRLSISDGRVADIGCKAIVWATNAKLAEAGANLPVVVPARGQVLLSPPIEGLKIRGTFHFEEGYYYFRNLGNRLLLGGARNKAFAAERSHEAMPTTEIQGYLKEFILQHFPQVAPAINDQGWMKWAGIMGLSADKRPLVKELKPGIWAALACNGMGVALTPLVGEEAAAAVISALK
jgi:glycine/D-amino acid oxidase-like deaminating enzyme